MILITSFGEFSFIILLSVFFLVQFIVKKKNCCRIVFVLSCVTLFLLQGSMFQWIRNLKGKWIKVSVLQEPNTELEISLRPMEYLEEEQQSQQPLERNLNAYKSMRDYRNPPWMSVPSCMVPPTNAPYGNSYKPCWKNHLNLSWGPEPTQYAPPPHPQYASTP